MLIINKESNYWELKELIRIIESRRSYTEKMIEESKKYVLTKLLNEIKLLITVQSQKIKSNLIFPMDTSLSICHRFDVEIPRGKFVEISSIFKVESTWKLWHRFDMEISKWIRLPKSTKDRWVLHVDFSMSFRCQIDKTSLLAVSILSFPHIFCSGNLF